MAETSGSSVTVNSWLEDELYQQYLHDRAIVDESWKELFQRQGDGRPQNGAAPTAQRAEPSAPLPRDAELQPLRGAAGRIAENMTASLSVPVATSQRIVPVKVAEENRRILNQHRSLTGKSKISFTHLVGWAVVKAVLKHPHLNHAFVEIDGRPHRLLRSRIHLGIAVDVAGKDGARSLVVPSIKDAGSLDFEQFLTAYDDLVTRARAGKLTPEDFQDTTISLTNPGVVGTFGSVPRLMPGQGAIIATGVIDYPPEYQGVAPGVRAMIGVSKVMSISCTYDHRIIQGAESGLFLAYLQELLQGEHAFYESIFADLKLPYHPLRWETDRQQATGLGLGGRNWEEIAKQAAVLQLINAYRVRGHLIANFDPLESEPQYHPELDPATYDLTIWDLDREFLTGNLFGESDPEPVATLREILETLRKTYGGKIGCEYMNIQVPEQKRWLQQHMEPQANSWPVPAATRRRVLQTLIEAETFEHFLHARFVGQKRFALEGAESAMAILDSLLEHCANEGVREVVIGMAHRGRLTVLANLIGKPLEQIFAEFEGEPDPLSTLGSGDVKYHLGASGIHRASSGKEILVSVAPNPSHLEAVDPVVEGIVRPKQDRLGDTERKRVIPVLVHGDAAFAGQGVVAETLNLSQLEGYTTGGTIHLIINNQIGFTTNPYEARSTTYCTDVARTVQAPIFHVNGDDPDACLRAVELAFHYRQTFKKDVVIDMFCYRRHGHNEGDDPSFTQPVMYRKIREHPSVVKIYSETLIREGVIEPEEVEAIRARYLGRLEKAFHEAQNTRFEMQDLATVDGIEEAAFEARTHIDLQVVETVIRGITSLPEGFRLHPKLRTFLERRKEVLRGGPIDWATAEALAFGSLLLEGTPVRLSGQDSTRGTFSQRHLEFYDAETGAPYMPLRHLHPNQARFDAFDSSLSEYAVVGFEFGYSLGAPDALVMWEAQFGDFANGAQIMIDQFVAASEQKWGQPSGLVLLLPHGYEGQGPEHSSARIERFLTLAAEDNIQLANATTPAQYFHLLRRQMRGGRDRRGVRKPLIIFTPKSLLRHPRVVSYLQDITSGTFQEVLPDIVPVEPSRVRRILLCSGKIFWELAAAREERKAGDIAILRIEQLYPFPEEALRNLLMSYPPGAEVVWVQEEPRNMGAWRFMKERIDALLEPSRRTLSYAGRPESASPATGSSKRHAQEQAQLIDQAFAPLEAAVSPRRRGSRKIRVMNY